MSEEPGPASEDTSQPLPQHPFVERMKPDPSQPAERVTELTGLPGDSDRPGYQRLYLTAKLDYYAEFLVRDIVRTEAVPADQSPLSGLDTTRVSIRRDATINYTWSKSPQPVDEFDLDVRLGAAGPAIALPPIPIPTHTCVDGCVPRTVDTCRTQCDQLTCATSPGHNTCATCPGQDTCATCPGQNTCATCPGQNTCATCAGQNTCVYTYCAQNTCACACPPHTGLPCIVLTRFCPVQP
jgi:hypothetical protein